MINGLLDINSDDEYEFLQLIVEIIKILEGE